VNDSGAINSFSFHVFFSPPGGGEKIIRGFDYFFLPRRGSIDREFDCFTLPHRAETIIRTFDWFYYPAGEGRLTERLIDFTCSTGGKVHLEVQLFFLSCGGEKIRERYCFFFSPLEGRKKKRGVKRSKPGSLVLR